ncbi:hypothetical protein K443DRAFT_684115 [Laccaria amethystina LaAM-08-1]|uniref:AAA+ ATPase domain-containing protein n=1 Tax=Laccaria amethystina LaAM-08-1 TaxID=1095629 RepID=A0A0C9XCS0_9AGAR|nr:hypothetical protein K443DRAFT_684115 [Laccaria amethystina LaAM-08-1]
MTYLNPERPYVLGASESLQKNDIVIAVVATTGVGKTTFINNFAGALLPLDNSLRGSNAGVQAVVIPGVARRRLILVEIPGCGSIARKDDQIEILVKEWLTSKYHRGTFSGVVLLDNLRHQCASTRFLCNYVKKHCKDMCKHLVLATMSCDKGREDMMVSGSWKPLIDKGATFFRLDNTAASASELAITLLAKDQSVSHTERLELRRRQAEWHAAFAGSPPPLRDPDHSCETAPLAFDHDLTQEDTIIALMGPTGTGKSSFINTLMGQSVAYVNDSVDSCTQEVQVFACLHPDGSGRRIFIIDTPGFDDSKRTDWEILTIITQRLTETYKRRIILSGIIQLCSIADTRMRGTPLMNMKIFEQLCGSDALKNVILTTTFWDQVNTDIGLEREAQLKSKFWAGMIAQGCRVARLNPRKRETAWEIINMFDSTASRQNVLKIQIEVVDEGKAIHDTSAFKMLARLLTAFKKFVRR